MAHGATTTAMAEFGHPIISIPTGPHIAMANGYGLVTGDGLGSMSNPGGSPPSIMDVGLMLTTDGIGCQGP